MIMDFIRELDKEMRRDTLRPWPVTRDEYELLEKAGHDMSEYCTIRIMPEYPEPLEVKRIKFVPYHKQEQFKKIDLIVM